MTTNKLTQDELVEAFNEYMPKRHVYPPLVIDDDEKLSNSCTESEGDDDEEIDNRRMRLFFRIKFKSNMSERCKSAYENNPSVKTPDAYLEDNAKKEVEMLLKKLVNLKKRPQNPVEWLAYKLLNLHMSNTSPRKFEDHHVKPTGDMLDFDVEPVITLEDFFDMKDPVFKYYHPKTGTYSTEKVCEKRKISTP